jgi:septal ring factor EnvC (AmiA/AmiB activator)
VPTARLTRPAARSLAADLAKALRDEQELQREIASINAEVEAEKLVQAAAKERLAILLDVDQVSAASRQTDGRVSVLGSSRAASTQRATTERGCFARPAALPTTRARSGW